MSSALDIQSPMSRTHKSNFSVPTLHGAQSAVMLGSHHPDPKSLRNSGRSHFHSGSSSSTAAPWNALDVSKPSEEVRNPRKSAIPLMLKRPTFKNLAKTRNPSFEGQRTPTLMSQPRCHDTCALEPVRFKNVDPCDTLTTDPSPYGPHNPSNGSLPEISCSGFAYSPPLTQSCPDVRDRGSNIPPGSPSSVHNLESRNFPSTSQDDISLHSQTVDKKHKSLKRQSRRVSLSLTSALSPSAPSQTPDLINSGENDSQHSISTVVTPTASGYTANISPVSPLSPIIFQSVPSSELDPTQIPVGDLITSEDFEDLTPITTFHPEMYSDALSTNSTCVNSSRSSSQSHSSSRDQFSSVAKTSCAVTPEPSSTTPAQIKVSPTQVKNREEEEETLVNEIMEGGYEETCITRSEEVWMGYWNRGSMTLVIDDLRELRAPKFSI